MLEDQVAYLLQRYLGNYVRGLNNETLKISVWKGSITSSCNFNPFDYSFVTSSSQSLSSRKFGSLSYVGDSGPCVKSSVLNHPAFARLEGPKKWGSPLFKAMSLREVRSWGHVTWGCDFPVVVLPNPIARAIVTPKRLLGDIDGESIGDSGPCVKSSVLNPPAFAQPEVPWSRLGQDPVLVSLDRIFLLAKPATQVQGCSEDTIQEVKKSRIRDMEMKLLESRQVWKMTPQAMGRTSVEVVYGLRLDFGLCLELLDKGIDSITCKKILR
ncbi:pleckstrin homology (PH) domain-containing protein [Actinidia rufa]|uniref:Pleckstrin homology (PH) domain-containing protein n=1 Tax=Actinidia rufa TaxID=165716 RepID=A0A7J0FU72_9ERIC|nr:pleckstrin homology (PH) domain-containing protein [Actinidia rufa]